MRPNVCNELRECHSPKLQSVANEPESMFLQKLTLSLGESNQFRLGRRTLQFCVGKLFLMMMIGACSSRLHFSHVYLVLSPDQPPPMLRRERTDGTSSLGSVAKRCPVGRSLSRALSILGIAPTRTDSASPGLATITGRRP